MYQSGAAYIAGAENLDESLRKWYFSSAGEQEKLERKEGIVRVYGRQYRPFMGPDDFFDIYYHERDHVWFWFRSSEDQCQ